MPGLLPCDLLSPRMASDGRVWFWVVEEEGVGGKVEKVVVAGVGVGRPSSDIRAEDGGEGEAAGSDWTRLRASSLCASGARSRWAGAGEGGRGMLFPLVPLMLGEGGITVTLGPESEYSLSSARAAISICGGRVPF